MEQENRKFMFNANGNRGEDFENALPRSETCKLWIRRTGQVVICKQQLEQNGNKTKQTGKQK